MELDQPLGLTTILRAEAPAAEHENHGMRALQVRSFDASALSAVSS